MKGISFTEKKDFSKLSEWLIYYEASAEVIQYMRLRESGGSFVFNKYYIVVFPQHENTERKQLQKILNAYVNDYLDLDSDNKRIDAFVMSGREGTALQINMNLKNPHSCIEAINELLGIMNEKVKQEITRIVAAQINQDYLKKNKQGD